MLFLFSVLAFLAVSPLVSADCETGWTPYNGHCFQVFLDVLTQQKAVDACHNNKAELVSIHSEDENELVAGLIQKANPSQNKCFWLGLKLIRNSGNDKLISAHWMDGSEMGYGDVKAINAGQQPWARYEGSAPEPNNVLGTESCVQYCQANAPRLPKPVQVGWVDHACGPDPYARVCKK